MYLSYFVRCIYILSSGANVLAARVRRATPSSEIIVWVVLRDQGQVAWIPKNIQGDPSRHQVGKNLPLTWLWQFWQLVGWHCSYILPSQDGRASQIYKSTWGCYRLDRSPCILSVNLHVIHPPSFDSVNRALRPFIPFFGCSQPGDYVSSIRR